jgi:ESS family glutamate:Na+ symporter
MNEMREIFFNPLQTIGFAVIAYMVGAWIFARVEPLRKYCIPIPVIGGMLFALVIFGAKQLGLFSVVLTTQPIQELFMNIFFTTIGFAASYAAVKNGGQKVLILFVAASVVVVLQNVLGISIASAFGINPLYGVAAGSVSMAGGHGTSGAFGPELEAAGAASATAIALASATIGLIVANIMGGPIARGSIDKYKLCSVSDSSVRAEDTATSVIVEPKKIFDSFLLILLAMGIGGFLGQAIIRFTPVSALPSYIGSLIVGAIIRNIMDATGKDRIHQNEIRCIGDIGIGVFLAMVMVSLDLSQIAKLAGPVLSAVLVILAAQTVLTFIFTKIVIFKALGSDYEAAVLSGGFVGLQMGATPNAVAVMKAVTARYKDAPTVFLTLPIVSGFLLDLVNAACITIILNIFG